VSRTANSGSRQYNCIRRLASRPTVVLSLRARACKARISEALISTDDMGCSLADSSAASLPRFVVEHAKREPHQERSEGNDEVEREHGASMPPAVAQGVSPARFASWRPQSGPGVA
jgi:hypothetical protein